jgi:hypothetical protein
MAEIEINVGQIWQLNTIDGTATIRISAVYPWPSDSRRPPNWRGRRLAVDRLDGAAVGTDWREFDLTSSPNAKLIESEAIARDARRTQHNTQEG